MHTQCEATPTKNCPNFSVFPLLVSEQQRNWTHCTPSCFLHGHCFCKVCMGGNAAPQHSHSTISNYQRGPFLHDWPINISHTVPRRDSFSGTTTHHLFVRMRSREPARWESTQTPPTHNFFPSSAFSTHGTNHPGLHFNKAHCNTTPLFHQLRIF